MSVSKISQSSPSDRVLRSDDFSKLPIVRIGDFDCHVIDEAAGIFAFRLLDEAQCKSIIEIAENHVASHASCNWRKLYTYTKADLPCSEVEALKGVSKQLEKVINETVADYFDHDDPSTLHPRTWKVRMRMRMRMRMVPGEIILMKIEKTHTC